MIENPPKIFSHINILNEGNYVLPDYILNKNEENVYLLHRFCPHRLYPLHEPGNHIDEVYCKFHNFKWTKNGIPINNDKKLNCGELKIGKSGLLLQNFKEPGNHWVNDLAKETNLVYNYFKMGESKGSWLWLMDAEADLLHLHKNGIHPLLSSQVKLEDITMEQGDGWILQNHPNGWWLYVFPFCFIEYQKPGCVMINRVIPDDINTEFGYKWISQFFYDPIIDEPTRNLFETCEDVFREDVSTSELQKGKYFPLKKALNQWENHCMHYGEWVSKNVNKK